MPVFDNLSRLFPRGGKMHPVEDVIKPALKEREKVIPSHAFHAHGFFEENFKLFLQQAVNPF
jgi:hypothetical protein